MTARRELQTLIKRLQATLATSATFSTNPLPFTSTQFIAAPSSLALNLAPRIHQPSKSLQSAASSRRWQHGTSSSNYCAASDPATAAAPGDDSNSADDMQQKVLSTALTLVKQLGWTRNALEAAATQLGLSPAIAGSFPRGAVHLVEAFNTSCNEKLREILSERKKEIEELDTKDKLTLGVQLRLEMTKEYIESWPDALALQVHPSEVPYSLQNYGTIADIIWRAIGDESTDFSWYTKRAALSSIYVASELVLLTDKSEGYTETWKFLEKRMKEMDEIGSLIFKHD
jgi:ubiquinone biosynthesis protein COQ9